jgi:hypothetical protein
MSGGVFKVLQYLTAFLLRKLKIKFLLAPMKSLAGENQPINQSRIRYSDAAFGTIFKISKCFKEARTNFTIIVLFHKAA